MLTIFIILFVCISAFVAPVTYFVGADGEEPVYSDVLEDLKKDRFFDASMYPDVSDDYSLRVITVAESTDGELLIYVYQPSHATKDLTATEIRFGVSTVNAETTYKDYKLKKISENGVFDKYVVEEFKVPADSIRLYDIVQIGRPWDKDIDDGTGTDNTIDLLAFSVGKRFTLFTSSAGLIIEAQDITVIEITNMWAGQIRYPDGFHLLSKQYTDSHFLVFSTNMKIDNLMEADVTFVSRDEKYTYQTDANGFVMINSSTFGNPVLSPVLTIKGEEVTHEGGGLFSKEYTWNRIEKASTFLNVENDLLDDTAKQNVQSVIDGTENTAWVLRFTETSYEKTPLYGMNNNGFVTQNGYYITSTNISQVSILRLKFITDGVSYNLGVVSNKVTSDNLPDGGESQWDAGWDEVLDSLDKGWEIFEKILRLVAIILIGSMLSPIWQFLVSAFGVIFEWILKGIGIMLKWMFKIVIWLCALPFKIIYGFIYAFAWLLIPGVRKRE